MNSPRLRSAILSFFESPRAAVLSAMLLRLAALGISLKYVDASHHHYQSQGREAIVLTYALITGHGYAFPVPDFVPTSWLAPAYVWILTLGRFISIEDGGVVGLFGQFLNVLFSALTCYPIFILGKKVAGAKAGLIAAWTWVFLPVAILMPIAFIWDQSLAALLTALLFVFSYKLEESSSPWGWCAYGLLWGVAALTNPAVFLLFPFFALWFWLRRRKTPLPAAAPLALATLACVLVLMPWTIRNWIRLGGFTFVKSNLGVELWLGNNPEVKKIWTPNKSPLLNPVELDKMVNEGELSYCRGKEREALSFIQSHPATFVRLSLNHILDTWTAWYDSNTDSYINPLGVRYLYILYTSLFTLAALAGTIAVLARDWSQWLPLTFAIFIFPIPYYVTHTSQRYRHPIDPILTVLAVVGVSQIWKRMRAAKESAAIRRGAHAVLEIPSAVST